MPETFRDARAYPSFLEAYWLKTTNAQVQALEAQVQALSDGFTTKRAQGFKDYFADASARGAYGVFFFPQSWARARIALAEVIDMHGWQPPKNARVLDIGAGLGAASLGAAMLLREREVCQTVELTLLDHSNAALSQAAALTRACAAQLPGIALKKTLTQKLPAFLKNKTRESESYDLIIAAFALNEVWAGYSARQRAELIKDLSRHLSLTGVLLVLEPALKQTALALQQTSDLLAEQNTLSRRGPYAQNFPCPLRAQGKYWAHDVRRWHAPESLQHVNRTLWRDVAELKFHWAAWSRTAPPEKNTPTPTMRLCTPFAKLKGRFEWAGVTLEGQLIRCDLPLRHLDKQTIKKLEHIERGDWLTFSEHETLEPTRWRIPSPSSLTHPYTPV